MDSGGTRLLWPPGKSVDPASWRNTESIKMVVKELDMHFSEHTPLEQLECYMVKPHGQLVRVSSIHYCTSTSRLSTL